MVIELVLRTTSYSLCYSFSFLFLCFDLCFYLGKECIKNVKRKTYEAIVAHKKCVCVCVCVGGGGWGAGVGDS